ncbi:transposase [Hymenobacter sp. UV11]|uniref:transposase n=1 Tax=Hymenobacter sp. UV11 TaxID=1849735 RepID=UPI00105B485D|nr:transposase [Hymenobacter sp. UV11]TDN36618.1 hypothetical protein A8B98_07970 [Hymenobacter sp. UV11]TFZ66119.1 transposase [Hymenobacter sp. UV11]
MKTYYRRNLPHILPPGALIFFTFRLDGSLAASTLQQLADERELAIQQAILHASSLHQQAEAIAKINKLRFATYDALLDGATQGPRWLSEPAVAKLVGAEIHRLEELDVIVLAYCLMSNHVHLVVQLPTAPGFSAARMMQRLKGRTALEANKLLCRQGLTFWRHESYDHVVRNEKELERVIAYVLNNPVKAGLVDDWTKWPYSYVR